MGKLGYPRSPGSLNRRLGWQRVAVIQGLLEPGDRGS